MNPRRNFVLIAIAGLLLSCGLRAIAQDISVDYDHQYKFNQMKGYSWGSIQVADPLLEPRIAAAVDKILQGFGYKESAKTGAQAVDSPKPSTLIITAIESDDPQQYVAFYRGMNDLDWHRSWGSRGFSDSAATLRQIHGGTLVVDMYDGPSGKLVWRGVAAEGKVTGEKRSQDDADKEVASIFTNFPPKTGGTEAPNQVPAAPSGSSQPRTAPN